MSAGQEPNTDAQDAYDSFDSKQRRRKRTKHGRYVADITYEELSRCFNMPALQACAELGIGLTMVKRLSRKYGIMRWPYRKNRAERRVAGWDEQHDVANSSDLDVTVGLSEGSLPSLEAMPSSTSGSGAVPAPVAQEPRSQGELVDRRWASSDSSHVNYHAVAAAARSPTAPAPSARGFGAVVAEALARAQRGARPVAPVATRAVPLDRWAPPPPAARPTDPPPPRGRDAALGVLAELSRSHPHLMAQLVDALAANQAGQRSAGRSPLHQAPPAGLAQPLRIRTGVTPASPFLPDTGTCPLSLGASQPRPRPAPFGSRRSAFSALSL
ncbi:hypothetical protein ACKKBF_B30550 [Auxenochlorella protothecoides x Auxenochlorella symbiontica]